MARAVSPARTYKTETRLEPVPEACARAAARSATEHFDGDGPPVFAIVGQKDDGHAAVPDFPLDRIAPAEPVTQPLEHLSHQDAPEARVSILQLTAMLRSLGLGDEPALEAFLSRHADFSMFLRSNSRAAGLVYEGKPLQAQYVAAFDGGDIVAVAAHCWNDMLLVQAPVHVADVARAALALSRRPVAGLSGPADQVLAARTALGFDHRPAPKFGREELFALDLADLAVPAPLTEGRWICRHPRAEELEFLVDWRVDFAREALQFPDSPTLRSECVQELRLVHERGANWVLEDGGLVSYSAFNAQLPDIVQIGGVWTPRELRGRGYGRAVVAGSLLEVRETGVRRAVLFAEREDAKRAYAGIGFRVVGEYGLVLFAGK